MHVALTDAAAGGGLYCLSYLSINVQHRSYPAMKFCPLTKLDELSTQLKPLEVHSVVTRDIGARKVVSIEYGDAGAAVVDVTNIDI